MKLRPMHAPGTGPAGPHLTADEWLHVLDVIRLRPFDDKSQAIRNKIRTYLGSRELWEKDAQAKKLPSQY